ncbi:hypothetical protein HU200_015755 [Digitaria exilis]|uniref:At1g61320/AtMIF1 LRR domain-containing protein n=1 Tax=Digitaria exilis TaxID=1010633 RepID=A0A835KHI7_9POAL|nr:hypothetical protein HU200_015755 [Digitaria exilis]
MASSSFHRLKRLHLLNVDLDGQFTYLLSTFPVMEDLDLGACKFPGDCSQGITLSTLKKLVLSSCKNNTSGPMVIMAPSLSCFDLSYGCYLAGIELSKMDSLVEAMIEITEDQTLSQNTQRELLGSLFDVTRLDLSGFETKVLLNSKSDPSPIFRNMRTLCLNSCIRDEYDLSDKLEALGSFLQNTPCLEKLILDCCMFISDLDYEWKIERKNITLQRQNRETLHCRQLKLIEVLYEHDHDHQLIEVLWWFGRNIPDANIKLTKIEI